MNTRLDGQLTLVTGGSGGIGSAIAGGMLYLVSNLSAFVTGETIEINGGMFMR